jgi:UDP-glucose 4-epimerase
MTRIFIAGGAGFIGSHMAAHQIAHSDAEIVIYDNFLSGKMWHLEPHLDNARLKIVTGDLKDLAALTEALKGCDLVYHYASNPDIAKAMTDPPIDFWEGTYLTQNLLEGMRANGVKEIVYASGSGVYGDCGTLEVTEDHTPMLPISTYGASKLACEVLIHSYVHMFDMKAHVFRFANVVGGRQTHGVAYDFIRRLRQDPTTLHILGDGSQSKSYIHVDDIVAGLEYFRARDTARYSYYHLATPDYLTVREIADLIAEEMGIKDIHYTFAGGDRGWKGDVPVVRFDLGKVHGLGWKARRNTREAMRASIRAMLAQAPG